MQEERKILYEGQKKSLYELSRIAKVPVAMLYDTVAQKRKLKNARTETTMKIAKTEGITVEELIERAKKLGIE